jgi:citrate synthase
MTKRYLTAAEATERLNVTPATLYAYVSRGLIRSEAADGNSRARRYHAEDVERLLERKAERQNPARVAETALHWGVPVLDSTLTLITDDRLYYRGYDVAALADNRTLEQVAALLWTGDFDRAETLFAQGAALDRNGVAFAGGAALSLFQRMVSALTLASEEDLLAYDFQPERVAQAGARILNLLTLALVGESVGGAGIAERLQAGWCPAQPEARALLNAALVLCADHELNASSFAARVAASADAQPYHVVIAGLAAARGLKHGGNTERVAALLREIALSGDVRPVLAAWVRRGERIPGFGHTLYPNGDPRAVYLLDRLRGGYGESDLMQRVDALVVAVRQMLALEPNIDFALVALAHLLALPEGAPFALFGLGRTVGWVAHAIEQYETQQLIRPRARYRGPAPGETSP